jgi:hypothetical protein
LYVYRESICCSSPFALRSFWAWVAPAGGPGYIDQQRDAQELPGGRRSVARPRGRETPGISGKSSSSKGENQIRIHAVDREGFFTEKVLIVRSVEKKRNVWAVVIAVNSYPDTRHLKYAVNDAMAFYNHLAEYNQVPKEKGVLLLDEEATLTRLRSALGIYLKN